MKETFAKINEAAQKAGNQLVEAGQKVTGAVKSGNYNYAIGAAAIVVGTFLAGRWSKRCKKEKE